MHLRLHDMVLVGFIIPRSLRSIVSPSCPCSHGPPRRVVTHGDHLCIIMFGLIFQPFAAVSRY
jgi:hypothetical protein